MGSRYSQQVTPCSSAFASAHIPCRLLRSPRKIAAPSSHRDKTHRKVRAASGTLDRSVINSHVRFNLFP